MDLRANAYFFSRTDLTRHGYREVDVPCLNDLCGLAVFKFALTLIAGILAFLPFLVTDKANDQNQCDDNDIFHKE